MADAVSHDQNFKNLFLRFEYLVCALGDLPAERWMDSDNLVARVNLPNMRYPAERRVDVYAAAMRGLLELEADPERRAKYVDFIDIYAGLTDNERARYRERYPEESNVMRGVVQRARDEGIEQGRVEGERTVLERLLRRRFGPLSPAATDRLHEASAADLEAWAERLLDARTPEEVFTPNP